MEVCQHFLLTGQSRCPAITLMDWMVLEASVIDVYDVTTN